MVDTFICGVYIYSFVLLVSIHQNEKIPLKLTKMVFHTKNVAFMEHISIYIDKKDVG